MAIPFLFLDQAILDDQSARSNIVKTLLLLIQKTIQIPKKQWSNR